MREEPDNLALLDQLIKRSNFSKALGFLAGGVVLHVAGAAWVLITGAYLVGAVSFAATIGRWLDEKKRRLRLSGRDGTSGKHSPTPSSRLPPHHRT